MTTRTDYLTLDLPESVNLIQSAAGYVALHPFEWSDVRTPRTDRPMRFGYRWHVGGVSGDGTLWVCLNRSGMGRDGWRVGHRGALA